MYLKTYVLVVKFKRHYSFSQNKIAIYQKENVTTEMICLKKNKENIHTSVFIFHFIILIPKKEYSYQCLTQIQI